MKLKTLNILLIVSSLIGYLEWGQNNSSFLFQAEYQVLKGIFTDITSVAHPLTLIPLLGQLLLIITAFQKTPSKALTVIGIVSIGILFLLMLFIGVTVFNIKIVLSTVPFFTLTIIIIRHYKKK